MTLTELLERSRRLQQEGRPHAWVTVIGVEAPTSAFVGAQAIVDGDGTLYGWIGGGCAQGSVRASATAAIAAGAPRRLRLSNQPAAASGLGPGGRTDDQVPGTPMHEQQPMRCASNGGIELFIQPVASAPRLRIYGQTPTAKAAVAIAQAAGFDPIDEQAGAPATPGGVTYALVATQGEGDETALESALHGPARAVLLVASERKTGRLRAAMRLRGISEERLNDLHAPAGLHLGGVLPGEIALAAVAGLVAMRRLPVSGVTAAGAPAIARPPSRRPSRPPSRLAIAPAIAPANPPANPPARSYVNPVCGAAVDPATAVSQLTLEGQTHYFCCTGCRVEFERDPAEYLAIGARQGQPA